MKTFVQDHVNEDIAGIIVMSHGPFAVAMVESAKMIFGEVADNVAAFSLEPGDNLDEFRHAFAKMYEKFPTGTVFLTDIYAGTPCNQVLQYAQEINKPVELVTGLSLPMLMVAISERYHKRGQELAEVAVRGVTELTKRVDVKTFLDSEDDED